MLDLPEVLRPQPVQRGAVELRRPADEVVDLGLERRAVGVVPGVGRDVPAVDEHRLGLPVLRLPRQEVAPLQQQDPLAGRGKRVGEGAASGPRPDDDDVVAIGHHPLLELPADGFDGTEIAVARHRPDWVTRELGAMRIWARIVSDSDTIRAQITDRDDPSPSSRWQEQDRPDQEADRPDERAEVRQLGVPDVVRSPARRRPPPPRRRRRSDPSMLAAPIHQSLVSPPDGADGVHPGQPAGDEEGGRAEGVGPPHPLVGDLRG